MKLRAFLVAVLSLSALPALAVAGPAAAVEDTVLTWPEVTGFNYATTPYVIHAVSQDLTGLQVRVNGSKQPTPVSAEGDLTPRFVRGGKQVVEVQRCAPTCVHLDSRVVYAYDSFFVARTAPLTFGPHRDLGFTYGVGPAGVDATVTWSIVDSGATPEQDVVLVGGEDDVTTSDAVPFGPVTLPAGTPDGPYELRRHLAGESATFGTLDRDLDPVVVTWDSTPDPGTVDLSEKVIYPEPDGYLDAVSIGVSSAPGREVVIRDGAGTERARFSGYDFHDDQVVWRPARALPAGRYTVRLTTTDRAGNTATMAQHLQVRRGHLAWRTFTKTLTAKASLDDSSVGSCSTLATRVEGRPKGALGYYSQTRCTRENDSDVTTISRADLPRSLTGKYLDFRLSVTGGKAKGVRDAYAVVYYYDAKKRSYVNRAQLSPREETHPAKGVRKPRSLVVDAARKPHVFWFVGLTAGSRYDVESFTVTVRYQVLVG
ncbi:hypothetical protein BH11ACT8_BH11ACT8_14830 [soil metagenome]